MKQQRWEEAGKESDEKKSEEKESAEKTGNSPNTPFSHVLWFRKAENRLAKATAAEPCGRSRDEKAHRHVAQKRFGSENGHPNKHTSFQERF